VESLGAEDSKTLHLADEKRDNTHTSEYGATVYAGLVRDAPTERRGDVCSGRAGPVRRRHMRCVDRPFPGRLEVSGAPKPPVASKAR
jgi:hypothetical protein